MAGMVSRRAFTQSAASLLAMGVLAQLLTPAAGARVVSAELAVAEDVPEDDQDEEDEVEGQEDEEPEEDPEEEPEDGEDGEDSGNHLGQRKAEIVPDPSLIGEHDNGKHNGLVKEREDDKVRGVGYWANLTGVKKQSATQKSTAKKK